MTGVPVMDFDRIDMYMKKPTTPSEDGDDQTKHDGRGHQGYPDILEHGRSGSLVDNPRVVCR